MAVISLVPSWTESLLQAGVPVVGRTRYCIHPAEKVTDIAVVGGTKDINWPRLNDLKAKLLIVDKEENRKEVLEKYHGEVYVSHVESIQQMPGELRQMHQRLTDLGLHSGLLSQADRWDQVLKKKIKVKPEDIPQVLKWVNPPQEKITRVVYLIWKNPYMAVGPGTFISSVLEFIGLTSYLIHPLEKYAKINIEEFNSGQTLLLFSSEPYDFTKPAEVQNIKQFNAASAILNGESFSWFGLRTLKFLESL